MCLPDTFLNVTHTSMFVICQIVARCYTELGLQNMRTDAKGIPYHLFVFSVSDYISYTVQKKA